MSVAPLPPPSGEWTPEEYDALPEDGYRRELVEGVLLVAVTAQAYADGRPARYSPTDVVLAAEIVSESSRSMDRLLKPHHYAAAGIPFHWRVELDPKLSVSTFTTNIEGDYPDTGEFTDRLAVTEPWPVDLDPARLPG